MILVVRVSQMLMSHSILPHLFAEKRLTLLIFPINWVYCLAQLGKYIEMLNKSRGYKTPGYKVNFMSTVLLLFVVMGVP